jgi:hypothetical protein
MPKKFCEINSLYYKPITIVSDDSSIINKLETSLIDEARVVIYDRHMFIVQATTLDKTRNFKINAINACCDKIVQN